MKKMIFLFTILCTVNQMYGMEPENPNLDNLPTEAQVLIIRALNSGKDVDATINAIKNIRQTNKAFYDVVNYVYFENLKGFTVLMDLLAKKFPNEYRYEIAQKFNTPIAQEYRRLGELFKDVLNSEHADQKLVNHVKELINKGLDPNFTYLMYGEKPILELILEKMNKNTKNENTYWMKIASLLMKAGANMTGLFGPTGMTGPTGLTGINQ